MLIQRLAGAARVLALALVLSLPVQAADTVTLPRGVTEVTSVEGITEYTLPNGLRVLLFPDATKPTVTVNITYMVGSRHENYGETGMAHLLEHMLFKGTPTHPDIPGEFRRRGISYNASAWYDRTNYFGSFAAGADNLAWLLALEADRMVNSKVAREDLDSEMTVVRNEMESGETNPFRVLISRMSASAYMWHNYGNTTIGARSDVENMPIERLQAFYRTHYRPDNATLLVAGRIDPSETLKLVNDSFGRIPRPATPIQPTYTREPTQDGEREVAVRRAGETPYAGVSYHVPPGAHADSAALAVLAEPAVHDLARVLDLRASQADRLVRLVQYRGPFDDAEWSSYHPEGRRIFQAFADGVNAYIEEATRAGKLPVEFTITGLRPGRWTAETSLLRTQTALPLGDARSELNLARSVALHGAEEANRRARPSPWRELVVPDGLDVHAIDSAVVAALGAMIAALAVSPLMAYAGFVVLGLGASVIAPTAFALVGRLARPEHRARAVARATMLGYVGYFFGPPAIGMIAAVLGLRAAFGFAALALLVVLVLAPMMARRAH